MKTIVNVENVRFVISTLKDLHLEEEDVQAYEELVWYGVTHIVTTISNISIFYIAIDRCKRRKVRAYLRAKKINPAFIIDFLP